MCITSLRRHASILLLSLAFLAFSITANAALDPAGEIDTSFNTTGFNSTNFALVATFAESRGVGLQNVGVNTGKIVFGGAWTDGFAQHFALLRVNPDGTQDFGFGTGGEARTTIGTSDLINDIAIQSDDKIVAVGFTTDNGNDMVVARYTADGVIDTTFGGGDGIVLINLQGNLFDRAHAVAIQSDQKILVAGYHGQSSNRDMVVARLNTNGTFDSSFGGGDGIATLSIANSGTDQARDIAIQSNGKIVVVGSTSSTADSVVARFNEDGTVDTAGFGAPNGFVQLNLGTAGTSPSDSFRGVAIQPVDQKIVAVGGATTTADGFQNAKLNISVLRFNTDGSLDSSFDGDGKQFTIVSPSPSLVGCPGGYFGAPLSDIAEDVRVQSDGKLVVGAWVHVNGPGDCTWPARFAVLRYTTAGALDSTFDSDGVNVLPSTGDDNLDAILLDGSGRAIVTGYRSVQTANPLPNTYLGLGRLTTGGALDTTFNGSGFFFTQLLGGSVEGGYALGVQSTNKPLVVGYTNSGTSTDFAVIRYNTNGTLDTSFDGDGKASGNNPGLNDTGRAVAIQSGDDKIIVAGDSYGLTAGSTFMTLMRFNANGGLDTSFSGDGITSTQFGATNNANGAHAVAIDSNGKIVAAGSTSEVPADWSFAVARFNSDGTLDTSFDTDGKRVVSLSSGVDEARAVAIQPADGKILVGGYVYVDTAHQQMALLRFNTNGSLDTSFDTDGIVITNFGAGAFPRNEIRSLAVLPDGKIVAGGKCNPGTNNSNNVVCVVRYNTNGSLDTSFDGDGIAITNIEADRFDEGFAIGLQRDDKVVAFAASLKLNVSNYDFAILRYNWDNGSLDTTFGNTNAGYTLTSLGGAADQANGGRVLSNGVILAGGTTNGSDLGAARYQSDPNAVLPGIPDLLATSDSGNSPTDNITNDNTPSFSGSCNAGDTQIMKINDAASIPYVRHLCRTGTFTLTTGILADGVYTFKAFSRNGKNDSGDSGTITCTIDTIALPPTISAPAQNASLIYPPSPAISGAGAEAGANVVVKEGATTVCSTTADGSGNWSCQSGFIFGTHNITATQTDIAGNTSAPSQVRTFTVTPHADLAVTKTDNQTTAIPGLTTSYTIVVTNNGPAESPNSTVTDTFSSSLTSITWTCVGSAGGTCPANGSGNINTSAVNLPVNATVTFTVNATIRSSAVGTLSNTASATVQANWFDPVASNNSATDNTTMTPQADVSITKTDGATTEIPGTSIAYTITVSNSGPSDAPSTAIADTVPAALTNAAWTCVGAGGGTCPANGTGNITGTADVPASGSVTYTLNASINPGATGTLSNTATATVAAGVTETNASNNSATDDDTLIPQADLIITKTDGTATEIPGTGVTYTIVASNAGPSNATGVSVSDTMPAALTGVTWTCIAAGGATCAANGSGNINESGLSLPAGSSASYTVNATINPSASGTLSNTATVSSSVTDPNSANNSATDTDTLTPQADLSITKTDGATTEIPGTGIAYTITVANSGPSTATGATVSDTLPAALTGATWTCVGAGGGSCTANGSGNINDSVNLPAGGSVTFTVNATISSQATGTLANTATVAAPGGVTDATPGNNSATDSDTLTAQADLAVTKTGTPDPVIAGFNITYTIEFSNIGPSHAQTVTVTDPTPANTTFTSATVTSGSGWSVSSPAVGGTGNIVFSKASVSPGETATMQLVVLVDPSTANGATITNSAVAAAGTNDPVPANNTATDQTTVLIGPDLTIAKDDGGASAVPGSTIVYTLQYSNSDIQAATGVTLTETVPAGSAFNAGASTAGWACTPDNTAGSSCTLTIGALAINASGSATFAVDALDPAPAGVNEVSNTATISSDISDANPADNSATDTTPLTATPDLSITKSDGGAGSAPGGAISYTLTYANNGSQGASGVVLNETVPANTTFNAGASTAGWTCAPNSNAGSTCTLSTGTLAGNGAGGSATFAVTVNNPVPAGVAQISNTATAADDGTNGADPTPANNSSSDTTPIAAAPDLTITKSDGGASANPGDTTAYTLTYSNGGNIGATGVVLTETVPAGTTFAAGASTAGWTCSPDNNAGSTCTLAIGGLAGGGAGGSATFAVALSNPVASGYVQISNTAAVSDDGSNGADPQPSNNTSTDTTPVNAAPDLSLTKDDGGASAVPGDTVSYTLDYQNNGNQDAAGAEITETIPDNTTFNPGASTAGWSCAPNNNAGSTCTLDIATISGNGGSGSAVFAVTVINPVASGVTQISNSASIADDGSNGADPTPSDNSDSDTTPVDASPDLQLLKSADSGVGQGDVLVYSLAITNAGNQESTGIVITETVPAFTVFDPASSTSGWNCNPDGNAGSTCTFNLATSLEGNGGTTTVLFAVHVDEATPDTTILSNVASVADDGSNGTDPNPGDNSDTEDTPILKGPGRIQFSAPEFSVLENSATATVIVRRSGGNLGEVSATFDTSNGTATANEDYTDTTVTVTFADGDLAPKNIQIPVSDDLLTEGNETVQLALSNPTGGATLGAQSSALLRILDDEPPSPGVLQFSSDKYSYDESPGSAHITVTRSGGTQGQVLVTFSTSNGTAVEPADYTATATTVTFADGDNTPQSVLVPIADDLDTEKKETVNLTLSDPTNGAVLGSLSIATLTILDNETPCLFCDNFEDGILGVNSNWSYSKNAWSESGGALMATNVESKTTAIAQPVFGGCINCSVEASMQTAGGAFSRVSLFAWYVDKSNHIELIMDADRSNWQVRQRVGGLVVKKKKVPAIINPGQAYIVRMTYNGNLRISVDGVEILSMLPDPVNNGSVGFGVKATSGAFEYIEVK